MAERTPPDVGMSPDDRRLHERERMAQLGALAAGLAHELNNPAAATGRAVEHLREQIDALEPLARDLAEHAWTPAEVGLLRQLERATVAVDQESRELDALSRGDREEAVAAWLDERGIARAWELAPVLVERGVTAGQLDALTQGCAARVVTTALAWTERMATIRQLLEEIGQSAARIADVVRAVKTHAYADAAAPRTADVHEGIESSLTILGHKLRQAGVKVMRAYDRTLPAVESYGTELSQVWTNLIDNAADAMAPGGGTVRVRTYPDGARVAVEITDTGTGIPDAIAGKIFDAFFTTKGAGRGTGLGLDIVRRIVDRHRGTIDVRSEPGDTRFTVRLPVTQRGGDGAV